MGGYFGGALSGLGQGLMMVGGEAMQQQAEAADEQRKANLAAAAAKTKAADDKAKAAWEAQFKPTKFTSVNDSGTIIDEMKVPKFDDNHSLIGWDTLSSAPNTSAYSTDEKRDYFNWLQQRAAQKDASQAPLDAALLRQRNNSAALSAFRLRQLQAGAAPPPAAGDDDDGAAPPQSAPPQSAPPQSATLGNLGAGGFNMSAGAGLGAPSIPSAHAVGRKVDPATGKVLILMSDGTVQQQ